MSSAGQLGDGQDGAAVAGDVCDVLETQQQASERFSELFADQPELVESVTPATLPGSLRITLVESAPIDDIVDHDSSFDGVEAVIEPGPD